jgi:hypothetical protein
MGDKGGGGEPSAGSGGSSVIIMLRYSLSLKQQPVGKESKMKWCGFLPSEERGEQLLISISYLFSSSITVLWRCFYIYS